MPGKEVLDTSALICWPLQALDGGFVVRGQKAEVERLSPERSIAIEVASLNWSSPSKPSLERATKIAISTGDLAGLSETDLNLFALALEINGRVNTDDYRLQNMCSASGLEWKGVELSGISEVWSWEIRCNGCKESYDHIGSTIPAREEIGRCKNCGSSLRIRKRR